MSFERPGPSRYQSLRASRLTFARAAPLVRFGLFSVGVSVFLDQVRPLVSDGQFTWGERRLMGIVAVVTLGGFGLAAWLAGQLLKTIAELIEVVIDGAEAVVETGHLVETQMVPSLSRAAAALERLAEAPLADGLDRAASAVRRTILEGKWGRAEQLMQALSPRDPEFASLAAELARAKQVEADDLQGRLSAARAADDAGKVMDCRDALTRHLRGEPLHDLDRRVARWVADHVQKRAKAGNTTPALVALASRAAESFGDSAEGIALHDAIPALRRRAGLCPGCGVPLRGNADACPDCRADQAGSPPRPIPGAKPGAPSTGRTP